MEHRLIAQEHAQLTGRPRSRAERRPPQHTHQAGVDEAIRLRVGRGAARIARGRLTEGELDREPSVGPSRHAGLAASAATLGGGASDAALVAGLEGSTPFAQRRLQGALERPWALDDIDLEARLPPRVHTLGERGPADAHAREPHARADRAQTKGRAHHAVFGS